MIDDWKIFKITLKKGFSEESCLLELEAKGIQFLYSSEDEGNIEIVFKSRQAQKTLSKYPFVADCQEITLPEIDWHAQWGLTDNDVLEIDLQRLGAKQNLFMQPGIGFGDLSHPTTQLILDMMTSKIKNNTVLDIGSGSGVLSLAAKILGAKKVIGLEIDPLAIQHSEQNRLLNSLTDIEFSDKLDLAKLENPLVIVMNMIMSEQKEAYDPELKIKFPQATILTTGILKEHQEQYLKVTKTWGWTLKSINELGEWLGFEFS